MTLKGTIAYASIEDEFGAAPGSDDDGFYVVGGIVVSF